MDVQLIPFTAVEMEPDNAIVITKNTDVEFSSEPFEAVSVQKYMTIQTLVNSLYLY